MTGEHVRRNTWGLFVLAGLAFALLASGCTHDDRAGGRAATPAPTPSALAAPALDYAAYEGHWCDSRNADRPVLGPEGMDSAEVSLCTSTTIELTLMHTGSAPAYRITASESTVTAPLHNGVARFTLNDDRGGSASGTITLLPDAAMTVRLESQTAGDNGAIDMDCLMRKDRYFDSREAEAPELAFDFIGVEGYYSHSSDQVHEPCIEVRSVDDQSVRLKIISQDGKRVYVKESVGSVVADDSVQLDLGTGQSLLLHWTNPGTVVVKSPNGALTEDLRAITKVRTYWNSEYLHTN